MAFGALRWLLRDHIAGAILLSGLAANSQSFAAIFDPLEQARSSAGQVANREAVIPVQCYTKTDGVSNPCWTCHTDRNGRNEMADWELQLKYAFSEEGKTNHWGNLFKDRHGVVAGISDQQTLDYIRQDNYTPLVNALRNRNDYQGWKSDLDFRKGFDKEGFAKDGSWWRAIRYKPFLGTFWPTNGSTDDVMIRLPWGFYTDASGKPSREIYRINLAIVEAALAVPDTVPDAALSRTVEPVNEAMAGIDLDGDGKLGGLVTRVTPLPARYVGKAAGVEVHRYAYLRARRQEMLSITNTWDIVGGIHPLTKAEIVDLSESVVNKCIEAFFKFGKPYIESAATRITVGLR